MPTFVRTTSGQFEPFHEFRGTSAGAKKAAITRRMRRGYSADSPQLQKAIQKYGAEGLIGRMSKSQSKMTGRNSKSTFAVTKRMATIQHAINKASKKSAPGQRGLTMARLKGKSIRGFGARRGSAAAGRFKAVRSMNRRRAGSGK